MRPGAHYRFAWKSTAGDVLGPGVAPRARRRLTRQPRGRLPVVRKRLLRLSSDTGERLLVGGVLLHRDGSPGANGPHLTEARGELHAARPAAALASHHGDYAISDLCRVLEIEPQAFKCSEPVLDIAPYLLAASVRARDGACLEGPPLEVGIHTRQHPI